MSYQITSDSTLDISRARMEELGIHFVPFSFVIDDKAYVDDLSDEASVRLYQAFDAGKRVTTVQCAVEDYFRVWEPILLSGEDVLYLAFSSGLSGAINAARLAREALIEKYPERKIEIIDTLCGSGGEGLIVEYAAGLRLNGASLCDVYAAVEEKKLSVLHFFSPNDVTVLKQSGRVPGAVLKLASLLHIKPILILSDEGRMTLDEIVKGRSRALNRMVERMYDKMDSTLTKVVGIAHANCLPDALKLKNMILERFPQLSVAIYGAGAVVAAHVGPGTIGVFYFGKKRTRMA